MDQIHDALALMPAVFLQVDVVDIDPSGADMRRTAEPAIRDAALVSSIARRGVLQPIGVRPLDPPIDGKRFQIAFGRRRLRCAMAAGLTRVPAHVGRWTDAEVAAITRVENMVRSEPHPIDRWCAVSDLVDAGFTVAEAAEELGLDERSSRQMERLGRLHPSLLALAEIQMPLPGQLRLIANAPRRTQQAAAKGRDLVTELQGRKQVNWFVITQRCAVRRIAQRHAIFDVARHAGLFTEDLFAEPGDPDAIATDQVAQFFELQQAALEARVEQQRTEGRRVQIAPIHPERNLPTLPKGFDLRSTQPNLKPKRTECVFTAIRSDGSVVEVLAVDVVAEKVAQKAREARQSAKAAPPRSDADVEQPEDTDDLPAEPGRAAPSISKAAQDLIAEAKTEALRAALTEFGKTGEPGRMLALMLLALGADNIEVHPYDVRPKEPAAQLVAPGGVPLTWSDTAVVELAGKTLARLLTVGGPSTKWKRASGPAAEWIGAAIGAGDHLPRFDTLEFLAQVPLAGLKDLAREASIKASGTAAQLRAALVGNLPDWRPTAAAFGAPGPTMREATDD